MKTYNYVYKITNLKPKDQRKYYIGVRTSKYKPEKDVNYTDLKDSASNTQLR